jgi:hypothetical protein
MGARQPVVVAVVAVAGLEQVLEARAVVEPAAKQPAEERQAQRLVLLTKAEEGEAAEPMPRLEPLVVLG